MSTLRLLPGLFLAAAVFTPAFIHATEKAAAHAVSLPSADAAPLEKENEQVVAMLNWSLNKWMAAVASRNVENILPLYDEHAILLPTVAANVHDLPAERKEYFEHFTSKENLKGVIDEVHFRALGENAGVASGLYTFSYSKNGQTYNVPARFTFVFEKEGNDWKIVEHHSSRTPE